MSIEAATDGGGVAVVGGEAEEGEGRLRGGGDVKGARDETFSSRRFQMPFDLVRDGECLCIRTCTVLAR